MALKKEPFVASIVRNKANLVMRRCCGTRTPWIRKTFTLLENQNCMNVNRGEVDFDV
jgi:hypothetical protein